MMNLPSIGQIVKIWGAPGAMIPLIPGQAPRRIDPQGIEVKWSVYWHRRLLDGAVSLFNPQPAQPAKKVKGV